MQQKKKRKLRASDIIITLLCLCICGVSLWFFWKDLNSSTTRTDIDKIGTIHFKKNISQRKFNDRVVWERLQQDSELYNNDTIRTSDDAEAVIHFADGTKIDLNENTMIQIVVEKDGTVNLSVGGGNIEVDTTGTKNSSVKLSMNDGSTVTLEQGSRLTAESGESGAAASVAVRDGNALVATAKGQSQKISGGEAVSIEKNGSLTKQQITVTSIPKNLTVYKMDGKAEPVRLEWKLAEKTSSSASRPVVVAETASDKSFKKLLTQKTDVSSINILPEQDKIWWRLYLKDDIDSAVTGEIKVVDLTRPVLTAPLDNSSFSYRSELPALRFGWKNDDYAEYYRLEVSRTQDFESPLISENLKALAFNTNSLDKGSYYWRVTPYYAVNEIGFGSPSATYSFDIEERDELTAPSLSLPADAAKIILSQNDQNVIFSWKSDVKAADYTIELSDSPDFTREVASIKSSLTTIGNKFNIKTLPEGTYYWKVLRNSEEDLENNNESAQSEVRSFTVAAYVPGVNKLSWPPDGYSVESDQLARLSFSWKLAAEYKAESAQSLIQFAKTSDFYNVVMESEVSDAEYRGVTLDKGDYYWRVGVTRNGSVVGLSEPNHISVLEPMKAPSIIQPEPDSKIILAYSEPVTIEWSEVNGADYYKLVIFDEEGNSVKSEKVEDTKARFELAADETFKKYNFSLQAVTKESEVSSMRTGAVSEASFELRHPIAVKLVSPVNNRTIDGLTALRTPTQFTWEAGDTPLRSVLTLQKQSANGGWRTVRTIENPKKTVSMSRLSEGRYRWNISASGENGLVLDSNSEAFVIKAVPPLALAELTEPAFNLKMDASYLKNHRNLSFKWKKVAGATDYDFAVYQIMSNGSYKKVYSQNGVKQTEVKVKDLSIFDLGTFEWRVTAYSHAKDGFEEQKSGVVSSRFNIDFRLPDKVNTKAPDTMYGD